MRIETVLYAPIRNGFRSEWNGSSRICNDLRTARPRGDPILSDRNGHIRKTPGPIVWQTGRQTGSDRNFPANRANAAIASGSNNPMVLLLVANES
ncbi:MAG TPA: hypothetical protein DEB39_11835 [Planctomycetaceae bacterium]|nr:hypothetical protein [Planctomycetaceae bacterium]